MTEAARQTPPSSVRIRLQPGDSVYVASCPKHGAWVALSPDLSCDRCDNPQDNRPVAVEVIAW